MDIYSKNYQNIILSFLICDQLAKKSTFYWTS